LPVEKKMSRKFLEDAYCGENMIHMRYLIFSEVAEKEGFPNVAKLFKAIAFAEQVHARNHYDSLGKIGKTVDNLQTAIEGETYESEEMYPVYNEVAKFQKEDGAERSTHYALSAEKIHATLYKKAKESVERGKDLEIGKVCICPVCGYTSVDEVPEYCPICGAPKGEFVEF